MGNWCEGSWVILFSHPADYTPVCTTELGRAQALSGEFSKRGVKMIALSCDEVESHKGWIGDILEYNGLTEFSYLIIAADRRLKLSLLYPATTGRNFDEIIRVIDSLQLTARRKVATPVDWRQGGACMVVPSVKMEDAPGIFPKGFKVHDVPSGKAYLRTTPQPE